MKLTKEFIDNFYEDVARIESESEMWVYEIMTTTFATDKTRAAYEKHKQTLNKYPGFCYDIYMLRVLAYLNSLERRYKKCVNMM